MYISSFFQKLPSLVVCACITFVYMVYGEMAYAAQVSLSPRLIDVSLEPRDTSNQVIVVTNTAPVKTTFFVFVNNVTVGLEGGVQEFIPPSMSDRTSSLSSWMEIQRSGFDIDPQSAKEVPLVIKMDSRANPGVYHALVSVAPGRNVDEAEALVRGGQAPSVLVTVTYEKKLMDSLKLVQFFVKKFITHTTAENMTYRLENTGDTEVKPTGDIILYNQKGEEVAALPVNVEGKTIQPGTSVSFPVTLKDNTLFGKYKAFLTVRYGSQGAAIYDTVYFYFFPWQKILISFIVLIVVSLGVGLWLHYRYVHSVHEEEEGAILPMEVRTTASESHVRDVVIKR